MNAGSSSLHQFLYLDIIAIIVALVCMWDCKGNIEKGEGVLRIISQIIGGPPSPTDPKACVSIALPLVTAMDQGCELPTAHLKKSKDGCQLQRLRPYPESRPTLGSSVRSTFKFIMFSINL